MSGLRVVQNALAPFGESTFSGGIASRLGQQVILDFYTYMALVGAAYQVRAGTITTPLVGDVAITDAAAEMASAAASGTTIIPVSLNIAIRLATGTLHEYAAKSAAVATMSGGTAFVPLPLRTDGAAATSTAMVSAAGGVTVAVETATTTRRHWAFANPVAAGAGHEPVDHNWVPRVPPVLKGPASFYVQIAATTTGPSYYASYDFLEAPSATLL
ncbi:MAG: hypothetical protein NUW01_11365 [Gemmatimonadaceae bacterium]|nr:hypothetical protein [Gemmatimonadaceae bacterium]